jgi:hypothetical protein
MCGSDQQHGRVAENRSTASIRPPGGKLRNAKPEYLRGMNSIEAVRPQPRRIRRVCAQSYLSGPPRALWDHQTK